MPSIILTTNPSHRDKITPPTNPLNSTASTNKAALNAKYGQPNVEFEKINPLDPDLLIMKAKHEQARLKLLKDEKAAKAAEAAKEMEVAKILKDVKTWQAAKASSKKCASCGGDAGLSCAKCLKVKYCNRECQVKDSKAHKKVCEDMVKV